jgi:two-component system, chemotaxis family, CheB/CheR fusion protein
MTTSDSAAAATVAPSVDADGSENEHPVASHLGFPVIGIGASAGGLAALSQFFAHTPPDTGMAFVVILHLSPTHESNADAILQRVTKMPVNQVTETQPIEPDHIYVIPPTKQLTMTDGKLQVDGLSRPRGRHVAIDLFFRTLAQAHGPRSIAVILSGTGSDGALGLRDVKAAGGLTMAQSPQEAEYNGMPTAAMATGQVDLVLPAAEMADKLVALWSNARQIQLPEPVTPPRSPPGAKPPNKVAKEPASIRRDESALADIMALLSKRTGHDFRHYKRATVLRRLERRLQVNALPNLAGYLDFLRVHPEETAPLLQDMLISVTQFFRDRAAYEVLEHELAALLTHPRGDEPLRAWVAGCATGEEAYSIAMLLFDLAAAANHLSQLQVFATDIDQRAIARARAGLYPEAIAADVPSTRLRQYFQKEQAQYRMRKPLRERILFAEHNLLRDPPFSRLDLVCCRNLLIYLDRDIQRGVLEMFHFALRPGGLLFLGSSESAEMAPDLFTVIDKKARLYRALGTARIGRVPQLPVTAFPVAKMAGTLTTPRPLTFESLHRRLIDQFGPPTILVDSHYAVVHLSERAGRYLRYPAGALPSNLLLMVRPELRLELRTALFRARQSGLSVEARRVALKIGDTASFLNMTVRPVRDEMSGIDLLLIVFDEVEASLARDAKTADERDPVVEQLELELTRLNQQLQGSLDESEVSTEELRASNEELQAINEELRSASEELETSKEELQSVNEELVTVNSELRSKVDEAGKVNDDLQNLVASTDIATVFVDPAMRIKRFTPRAAEVFNVIPTDVGRSLLDLTHRLDYDELVEDATQAFEHLRTIEREVVANNGRWYLARVSPYRTVEDHIDGAVLNFIDISARRRAEDALHLRDARLRLMAESTRDYAIITLDAQGRVTSWNKGAEQMFGYTEVELLDQTLAPIFTPEDRAAGEDVNELERARADGRAEDERWHVRKDGTRFFCSGIVTPLFDRELLGYAKIARDLTHRRMAEKQREEQLVAEQQLREQLQAASALKDEFLAVLSHELKNPLNLIQLNAELLARLPQARDLPTVARAADTIRRTVRSQAKIIDDLLDLSRLHTGKLGLQREPMAWAPLVLRIVDAMREDASAKSITLDTAVDDGLMIDADSVRVEQIVWNLLSNALKFTPESGRIVVSLQRDGTDGRLQVSDSGVGLDPAVLPHVFDMFRQGAPVTSRRESGLGIGLALVKNLAQLHGGRVEADSAGRGQGATFSVWLPLIDAPDAVRPKTLRAENLRGLRVLVVDDMVDAVETAAALLRVEGAEVDTATSAAAALTKLGSKQFDLLLSDIAMPGTDGYALIRSVREQPATATLPAIALTGFGRAADEERALTAGFQAHLGKPFAITDLVRLIKQLVPPTLLLKGPGEPSDEAPPADA